MYTIVISEAQREALRVAVMNAPLRSLVPPFAMAYDDAALEVSALLDMLTDLPHSEQDAPGSIHDFTA